MIGASYLDEGHKDRVKGVYRYIGALRARQNKALCSSSLKQHNFVHGYLSVWWEWVWISKKLPELIYKTSNGYKITESLAFWSWHKDQWYQTCRWNRYSAYIWYIVYKDSILSLSHWSSCSVLWCNSVHYLCSVYILISLFHLLILFIPVSQDQLLSATLSVSSIGDKSGEMNQWRDWRKKMRCSPVEDTARIKLITEGQNDWHIFSNYRGN